MKIEDLESLPPSQTAVSFAHYGPPEVLTQVDQPVPAPGPTELVIRVAAAGVNPADYAYRAGRFRFATRGRLPYVPGFDVAGVVVARGRDVDRRHIGDPVFAMLPLSTGGAYAQYAVVDQLYVALAPGQIRLGEAAALPLAALTALQALRDRAEVRPGAEVLIYGAAGGVGHLAVQIARILGARVTAVTSRRNVEFVRNCGADAVLDYEHDDILGIRDRFDVTFDAVNRFPFRRARRLLRPAGIAVTVQPVADKLAPDWLAWTRSGRRLRSLLVKPGASDLRTVASWSTHKLVRCHVSHHFDLADAAAAHHLGEQGHVRGKLVLVVDKQLASLVPDAPNDAP